MSDAAQNRSMSRGEPGASILRVDVAGTAAFVLTAVLEAVVLAHWSEVVGVAVALGLFVLGCLAFLGGYARAVQRSRTDDIDVGGLFLLMGPAVPPREKRLLHGLLAVQVLVAVVTAAVRPFTTLAFGVLVPVFGLGLNGLWAARHGRFPPRPAEQPKARERGSSTNAAQAQASGEAGAAPNRRSGGAGAAPNRRSSGAAAAPRPRNSRTAAPERDRPATAPASGGDAPRAGSMEQNADHG